MRYRAYGLILDSQRPIPALSSLATGATDAAPDITLEYVEETAPDLDGRRSLAAPGLWWPMILRDSSGYWLSFEDDVVFWVAVTGQVIRCYASGAPRPTMDHLLLDHVLPRTLALSELSPLHATAVSSPVGALAFLGGTGAGKSSIAAMLGALGCRLISDDCLLLRQNAERIVAIPSYPGLRLRSDVASALFPGAAGESVAHYTDKQRITHAVALREREQALSAIYQLEPAAEAVKGSVCFEHMGPAEGAMALTASAFRMDVGVVARHKEQLHFLAGVVAQIPVRRCRFEKDLGKLPELGKAVLADAMSLIPRGLGP